MPKIIENLRQRLVAEAQRQVEECGYSAMTIRSVAAACGVGVGTVYNYFTSKDALVATFMLEDWQARMDAISAVSRETRDAGTVFCCIHRQLLEFVERYQAVFADETAVGSFSGAPSPYHTLLRTQLASPLRKFCPDDFTAEFIAESLLTWTVAGRKMEEIKPLLEKLL